MIDWDHLVDRTRGTVRNSHWTDPADIISGAANSYHVDHWEGQENFVVVLVEKQALEGVLTSVCNRLDVWFLANKGYSSVTTLHTLGRRLRDYGLKNRVIHIIYLGDHDPSGIDMTRDVYERLNLFSGLQG